MQTASFGLLACGAVFEFSMDRTSVCVCEDQIAATCHLALAPIRVVSHSEELVLVQNLYQLTLFVNILSHNACIMIQILYDHMDRIS